MRKMSAFITGILYILIHDNMNQYYEYLSDIKSMQTGPEYYNGCIDYYEGELKRNNALKRMMGDSGSKYFTENGNTKTWLRFYNLPITQRLALIEEYKLPIKDDPAIIR